MCFQISQHRQKKGSCFHNFSLCNVSSKYYILYIKPNFQPSMFTCFYTLFFTLFFRPIHFLNFIFVSLFLRPFSPCLHIQRCTMKSSWTFSPKLYELQHFFNYLICVTRALLSRSHILSWFLRALALENTVRGQDLTHALIRGSSNCVPMHTKLMDITSPSRSVVRHFQ